jgi:hypothetical protein
LKSPGEADELSLRDLATSRESLPEEIARRLESGGAEMADRGAVWTYLTTDQPIGRWKREVSRRLPFWVAAGWGAGA